MRAHIKIFLGCWLLWGALPGAAQGGGNMLAVDITGRVPSSEVPGLIVGGITPIRWDSRCLPVKYRVNDVDPIPNPLGPPVLTLAQATAVLQESLDAWNDIPTSFIDMRIIGTTTNPGDVGLDMTNEVTFHTSLIQPGTIGVSTLFHLIEDTLFIDGDDLDGDGLPDVSGDISVCTEVNGRIKFPAGLYKAGTIIDNDVYFFTDVYRFTVGPPDTDPDSVDLMALAVHEFGHSHGIAHSLTNQLSVTDGRGAAMFPIIDTAVPQAELNQRTLTTEDIAWSSFTYPEGSAREGPSALGPGDVAFDRVYGKITGRLRHGILKQDIVGANVFAVAKDPQGVDTVVSSGFSGTVLFLLDPVAETLEFVDTVDGKYVVPVPRGTYKVGVEPLDEFPAFGNFNLVTEFGPLFGGHDFNEEFVGRGRRTIKVEPGKTVRGIDITTSRSTNIDNFGTIDSIGFTAAPPGSYYAMGIPAAQILAAVERGHDLVIESADFMTITLDDSVVADFAEAMLTTGRVNPDGTASVDLTAPLERVTNFAGQDFDFARLMFKDPVRLGDRVRRGIHRGQIENLFLVLRVPTTTPFPGTGGIPPLIGLDGDPNENDVPIFGLSFFSNDNGVTFRQRTDFNFMFRLVLSN